MLFWEKGESGNTNTFCKLRMIPLIYKIILVLVLICLTVGYLCVYGCDTLA